MISNNKAISNKIKHGSSLEDIHSENSKKSLIYLSDKMDKKKEAIIERIIKTHEGIIEKADYSTLSYGEIRLLLEKRIALRGDLQLNIESAKTRSEQLDVELRTNRMILENAIKAKESMVNENEELKKLKLLISEFDKRYAKSIEIQASAEKEHDLKIIDYNNDPIFMHMIEVGYGTESYSSWWPISSFHKWLDKRIDMKQSLYNYEMLKKIKTAAAANVQKLLSDYESSHDRVESILESIETNSGLSDAIERADAVEKRMDDNKSDLIKRIDALRLFDEGKDISMNEVRLKIKDRLRRLSVPTLEKMNQPGNPDPNFLESV